LGFCSASEALIRKTEGQKKIDFTGYFEGHFVEFTDLIPEWRSAPRR
jgi:hypothetical protein